MSLLSILGSIAPTIASALPGPLGTIAKGAVTAVLGLKPGAQDAEIEKALAASNPEILLKLKQADLDFAEKMKQLDIDLTKLAAEDAASARGMQIQTKARAPGIIAGTVVTGWFAAFAFLIFHPLPSINTDAIMLALGTLNAGLMAVLGFYFGSSMGSQKKDETIKNLSAP